jgi:hypothetical protein
MIVAAYSLVLDVVSIFFRMWNALDSSYVNSAAFVKETTSNETNNYPIIHAATQIILPV